MIKNYALFNLWANTRMVECFRACSEEQLHRPIVSSFPSLHTTFLHLWSAEQVWLDRLHQHTPNRWPQSDFVGSTEEVFDNLLDTSQQLIALVNGADADYWATPIDYTTITVPEPHRMVPEVMLHHLFNHQTMHRGQLITMGRQVGLTAFPRTDFVFYARSNM
jgi:uncharacterized damage-inducible protein DinB